MKILYAFLLLISISLLGNLLGCDDYDSLFQLGGSYDHINIKIHGQTFNGNLGGIQGSYEYKPLCGVYAALKESWKQGDVHGSLAHRELTYNDLQERIGYTYASNCNKWSLTLFSGLGYRYLKHNLKACEESNVKFRYNEFYMPLGFLSEYVLYSCFSIGLNFTWMPQIYPTVEIIPLKGARWILDNSLNNMIVELPFTYFFTKGHNCAVILKPTYQHWEDGKSKAKTSSGEKLNLPKNIYQFWGCELNFLVLF